MDESDRLRLQIAAALRAIGTSLAGVLLGLYLAELGCDPVAIGYISSAGLFGSATAATLIALYGDGWGRRRSLLVVTLLGAIAAAAFLAVRPLPLLCALAFFGMLNAMGRDRAAAATLEQSTLPATVPPERRTLAFAVYTALQDAGHALGSLAAGLAGLLAAAFELTRLGGLRATLAIYPLILLATMPLYAGLGSGLELMEKSRVARLSPQSRRILLQVCGLFALDGIGGGFLVGTLLTYFFFERFGAGAGTIAALFFAARLANMASHLGAAWLARKIGLVNTMVFTHIPSSLMLIAVAYADSLPVAAAFFLLRECLVEMDVPTRQSYVMAVVAPEERTAASGATNVVRLLAWAVAPLLAGLAMQHLSLAAPLLIGAAIKILYDVLLYLSFRSAPPPEEQRSAAS